MRLVSATGYFQNLMELTISGLSYEVHLVYIGNMIVSGRSFEEHSNCLDFVLR